MIPFFVSFFCLLLSQFSVVVIFTGQTAIFSGRKAPQPLEGLYPKADQWLGTLN